MAFPFESSFLVVWGKFRWFFAFSAAIQMQFCVKVYRQEIPQNDKFEFLCFLLLLYLIKCIMQWRLFWHEILQFVLCNHLDPRLLKRFINGENECILRFRSIYLFWVSWKCSLIFCYLHSSWNGSSIRKSRQVGGYELSKWFPHFLHGSLKSFK